MKKIITAITFLMLGLLSVNAQEISDNAIGLRLTENSGFGAEISYQRRLSDMNRLEIDLGLRGGTYHRSFKAIGLYEWVWQIEGDFNWYAGAGAGIGSWTTINSNTSNFSNGTDVSNTFIFGAGVIGIEYNFDFPLIVSLDFRPEIGFSTIYDGFNADFGLSARYQF